MPFLRNLYQMMHAGKSGLTHEIHTNRILQGRMLAELNNQKPSIRSLDEVEFKVFSQWGDDGIIQYLIHHIDIPEKTFVEFGVENYTESNTRFLLMNNNWSGFIMDGSENHIDYIRKDSIYWKYDLQCKAAFITAENVNDLIASAGFGPELGILHIDIDGNDYWVWKAVHVVNPVIVIVEYNSIFGPEKTWTVPYAADYHRTSYHYSNLMFGASVQAFCDLAEEKGYAFVGCNSAGNNAYFVRKDKIGQLPVHTSQSGFRISKFKESRNERGELDFKRLSERLDAVKGCQVYNTRTQQLETIQ